MEEEGMFGPVFSGVVMGVCALLMIGIGISNIKSKKPCGFYTGEKGPDESELRDKDMWNKKHGWMWIIYGIIIMLTWVIGLLCKDSAWIILPYTVGLLAPIPLMIAYHNKLIRDYVIKKGDNN